MKTALLILLLFTVVASATTIQGVGYGENSNESVKDALSELSNRISVEVKSDFQSYTAVINKVVKKHEKSLIDLSSSLPILGADIDTIEGAKLSQTTATLSSQKVLRLYMDELKRLKKEIGALLKKLSTTKDENLRYTILNNLLKDIESFDKHNIVARLLGAKEIPQLQITKGDVEIQLQKLQERISSLDIAADFLTSGVTQNAIYISAVKPSGSSEVTQFAKVLKEKMAQHLKTTRYPDSANYFLRGRYEILKDSIFITVTLLDTNNNILQTKTATLSPKAYKNLAYKPKTKSFDEALKSGFVKSGKLYVRIGFRGYSRDDGIVLKKGDTVDIVAKTNKPICYFLAGYVLKEKEKFAYLLPIGSDDQPFINYITGDDVNKNITLFEDVPVDAPYGSESLHIIASTLKKNGSCPLIYPKCSENLDGYCVIEGTPTKALVKTRSLNLKKRKVKIEKTENSISWSSFKN